jgi:glycerol kinase
VWPGEEGFAKSWRREKRFAPAMEAGTRSRLVAGWRDAVDRTRTN